MAGLIQQAMQPAQGEPAPAAGAEMSPANVRAQMHLPPELQEAYQRVVAAGMKVLFDPSTHEEMLQGLQGEGDISQKLGMGIAGVVLTLYQESNQTMPPQVVVPAGVELMAHAAEFLNGAGMTVTPEQFAEAVALMVETLLKKFGVDPAKMVAMVSQYGRVEQPGGDPARQPPAAPAPEAAPAQEEIA